MLDKTVCLAEDCEKLIITNKPKQGGGRKKLYCTKKCYHRQRSRNLQVNNPEEYKDKIKKANYRRYGISEQEYLDLLKKQNNKCAICFRETPGGKGRFHIDHDHSCCPRTGGCCGKCIRGLLCHWCNLAAGNIKTPEVARYLATYLEEKSCYRLP